MSSEKNPHTFAIPFSRWEKMKTKPEAMGTMSWNGIKFVLVRKDVLNALQNKSRARRLKKVGNPISERGIFFRKKYHRRK